MKEKTIFRRCLDAGRAELKKFDAILPTIIAASVAVCIAPAARADSITVSFNAVVSGQDVNNLFGGGNLNSQTAAITVSYNTSDFTLNPVGYPSLQQINDSGADSSNTISVTINGYSWSVTNSTAATAFAQVTGCNGYCGQQLSEFYDQLGGAQTGAQSAILFLHSTTSSAVANPLSASSVANWIANDASFGGNLSQLLVGTTVQQDFLYLSSISAVTSSQVPEPATVATMFGGAVVMMLFARRRMSSQSRASSQAR
jgi:hypothetical protein